jgi:bifunctional DNA-binding transcriptional regulator/antitoxin component of YhaV-PrlF toxin-antitoxin module
VIADTASSAEVNGIAGETTITGKNQVSLPARGVRQLGWERGDRLLVHVLSHDILLLTRKPENPAEHFAGKLGHVFGTHDETMRFLEEERASWTPEADPLPEPTKGKVKPQPATPVAPQRTRAARIQRARTGEE